MNEIDFLPQGYRREHSRRRRQVWQFVAIALVTGIIATATLLQWQMAARFQARVDDLMPQYQESEKRNKQLAELTIKLGNTQDQAELFTYLRHPWPKTQILATLLKQLPKDVTLQKIKIFRKLPIGTRQQNALSQSQRESEEQRLASLSPAARDLEQIRSLVDPMQIELTIIGTTTQPAALHEYVIQLGHESFFSKAELESIESVKSKNDIHMRFELHLRVQPGYGQPGGPIRSPIAREKARNKTGHS